MSTAILGLSRYLLIIFILFYTLHCFIVFAYPDEDDRRVYYVTQNILMVFIHVLGFYVLSVRSGRPDLLFICALQEIMFLAVIILYKILYPEASRLVVNNMCMLLAISFIMLTRLSYVRSIRQFVSAVFALLLTLVIPYIIVKIRLYQRFSLWYGVAGIVILLAVMTLGTVTNGSRITLTVAGITFQPSELVKILFVFFVAGMLTDKAHLNEETGRPDKVQLLSILIIAGLHILILALSKDLGSALIFFVVFVFMLYAALKTPLVLAAGGVSFILASAAGYTMFSHVRTRVRAWLDPMGDIEGSGYQISQSLFAIGTGSWFGMGLLMGSPDKIPVVAADFIFAAISEEMGCLFSLCLILICVSNFLMFMNISMTIRHPYYRLISLGLAVNYGFQMFLTIGGVTKFIPLTGVTLPLVSYGGTSILSTLVVFSIIQGLYIMHHREFHAAH